MLRVTATPAIPSRVQFKKILSDYTKILKDFPGFVNVVPSGSYNSDMNKSTFGDMDIVVTFDTLLSKKEIKVELAEYLTKTKKTKSFISEKYNGRMFYNSGEIITVNFMDAQIDNIIALSPEEATFKTNFLDLPAEKQGLLLGLMKVVFIEEWDACSLDLKDDEEVEYNLSSKELQLRKIQYKPGTLKEVKRTILQTSTLWDEVQSLVPFDFNDSFEEIVEQLKNLKPRSRERIKGIFKSMVSVKSGEVGKQKGQRKTYCLEMISKL